MPKKITLMVSGKVNAVYVPGGTTYPSGKSAEMIFPETDDPEVLMNYAVASAMNHAGSIARRRLDNKHVEEVTVNVHIH